MFAATVSTASPTTTIPPTTSEKATDNEHLKTSARARIISVSGLDDVTNDPFADLETHVGYHPDETSLTRELETTGRSDCILSCAANQYCHSVASRGKRCRIFTRGGRLVRKEGWTTVVLPAIQGTEHSNSHYRKLLNVQISSRSDHMAVRREISLDACIDNCHETAKCRTVQWTRNSNSNNGLCLLKTVGSPAIRHFGTLSVVLLQPMHELGGDGECSLEPGLQLAGLGQTEIRHARTPDSCCTLCQRSDTCVAFDFFVPALECRLSDYVGPVSRTPGSVFGLKRSSAPTQEGPPPTFQFRERVLSPAPPLSYSPTPRSNRQEKMGASIKTESTSTSVKSRSKPSAILSRQEVFSGESFIKAHTDEPFECLMRCARISECLAVTYDTSSPTRMENCQLKSSYSINYGNTGRRQSNGSFSLVLPPIVDNTRRLRDKAVVGERPADVKNGLSLDQCQTECNSRAKCQAFNWMDDAPEMCILYERAKSFVEIPQVTSGVKVFSYLYMDRLGEERYGSTSIGAKNFHSEDTLDIVQALDLPSCARECSSHSECKGYAFDEVERECSLKSTVSSPKWIHGGLGKVIHGSLKSLDTATPAGTVQYSLLQDVELDGPDEWLVRTEDFPDSGGPTLNQCIGICAVSRHCGGFTWVHDNP